MVASVAKGDRRLTTYEMLSLLGVILIPPVCWIFKVVVRHGERLSALESSQDATVKAISQMRKWMDTRFSELRSDIKDLKK